MNYYSHVFVVELRSQSDVLLLNEFTILTYLDKLSFRFDFPLAFQITNFRCMLDEVGSLALHSEVGERYHYETIIVSRNSAQRNSH